jgi:asparagine synthase (glutamine-hydrolysing)
MCGIAGYVSPNDRGVCDAVRTMIQHLARRGPDSEGIETWPGVALGHRRLAILDLSPAGRQPMLSDDGQVGVVFNGCIYNFLELRGELERRGQRFRSNCDTEVLVRGYREWGIDALVKRLRGMFAFGIWDQPRRKLTLVRDRLGVKPLVYCARDREIGFASTPAALRAAGFGGEIDPQAVIDLLEFGFVTEDRSIYQEVHKLQAATILEWEDGRITQRQYWTVPECDETSRITFDEAVEETERLIVESVRLRLISDVPVGVLLSGGIDSGLVCWGMSKLNANVRAFTVGAPNDPSDETAGAAETARALGISHQVVDMPERTFSLDALIDAYSEPFPCSSAQAMLWVADAVKQHATVLLTGDGGDDVFFGYPFFRNARMAQSLARVLPGAAPALWRSARGLLPDTGVGKRVKSFLNYATGGIGAHARAHSGIPYYEQHGLLGERLAGRQVSQRQIPDSLDSARRLVGDVFSYHRRMGFAGEFMTKVDGATMYYGIEARAPFLDQEIWEFAATLPEGLRFRGGKLKAVLREIARRRIGPRVASRKKQGFTVPVERWLAGRWRGLMEDLGRGDSILERDGWIAPAALRRPVQDALRDGNIPLQVWRLLVLEHWLSRNSRAGVPPDAAGVPAGQLHRSASSNKRS